MAPGSTNNDRISSLETTVKEGFAEMKGLITGLETRLRAIENSEASCRVGQDLKMTALEKSNTDLQTRVGALEKELDDMRPWWTGLRWVAGILGASTIALIWGILTHTITIGVR